jgi:murein DD-endopeptidase MepM/ murein hydrolase activator NlpD
LKGSGGPSLARKRAFVLALFCACVFFFVAIFFKLQTGPTPVTPDPGARKADSGRTTQPGHAKAGQPKVESPPVAPPPENASAPEPTTTVTEADLSYISALNLLIPVANVTAGQLRDTFNQARSEGRRHDAIDIMAAQGTPVLATADGVVTKLFQSDRGGITLYELDPSGRYVYYYAHLMRYADGVVEGKQLRRGDVIAYVGDTGKRAPVISPPL